MNILHLIGWISGLALLALGFIHIIILDKIFRDKPGYLNMKWWIGKITIALTIIFFSCAVAILVNFLIQK